MKPLVRIYKNGVLQKKVECPSSEIAEAYMNAFGIFYSDLKDEWMCVVDHTRGHDELHKAVERKIPLCASIVWR